MKRFFRNFAFALVAMPLALVAFIFVKDVVPGFVTGLFSLTDRQAPLFEAIWFYLVFAAVGAWLMGGE